MIERYVLPPPEPLPLSHTYTGLQRYGEELISEYMMLLRCEGLQGRTAFDSHKRIINSRASGRVHMHLEVLPPKDCSLDYHSIPDSEKPYLPTYAQFRTDVGVKLGFCQPASLLKAFIPPDYISGCSDELLKQLHLWYGKSENSKSPEWHSSYFFINDISYDEPLGPIPSLDALFLSEGSKGELPGITKTGLVLKSSLQQSPPYQFNTIRQFDSEFQT